MATERAKPDKEFLTNLARGGFAESLSPTHRRAVHIETKLDEFLDQALSEGRQVVLTGNPGDGKTQHILMCQDSYPEGDYFYLLDASEYADYRNLLDEWKEAYDAGKPGILAINDGPLYRMTTEYQDEYEFLSTVEKQLKNQIIYSEDDAPDIDFDDINVIDLNNRNVLTHSIISQAIRRFSGQFAMEGHEHSGTCHIEYNAQKLQQKEIRENLIDLLHTVGHYGEHVTVRDLINFLCYVITGGKEECDTSDNEELRYYNLAFTGNGLLFDLVRRQFHSPDLVHPFIDSHLWARAEQKASFSDLDDADNVVYPQFLREKRRFLFEDKAIDLGYESRKLFQNLEYDFLNHRNRGSSQGDQEQFIRLLNGYFRSNNPRRSELDLWLSHRYRSKSSLALVSRTSVAKSDLVIRQPRLHPQIEDAINYSATHNALEYDHNGQPVRLRIDSNLFSTLSALDASVPYTLRDRDTEQQILEFMQEVEYYETYSSERGTISVKDTETGRIETIDVNDEIYQS